MTNNFHALVEDKIFMGGAADVPAMITEAHCDVIVDLREEAADNQDSDPNVTRVQVPIGDNAETPQEDMFKQAISIIADAYKSGKRVGFHCGGGKGRTGTVAIGTLIELGLADSIEEAETKAKSIRPIINIREPQRDALKKLYNK
ncbi:dual specificity protein phosphatase-like protein [Paenibacillus taihuensis]|uniref:Dual specificity protein phosphatase-like protein n=1 Tax=Paenibacillus taihuensis TaxID=1156355 RepID=A0A3D9RV09_9BACL|nr:dual specificity protein phosphatase family protein [Paenibacillus taihuensis]REE81581.1 dual specificity protein phosphatase-like protein [Paenibacillus taihuensis]